MVRNPSKIKSILQVALRPTQSTTNNIIATKNQYAEYINVYTDQLKHSEVSLPPQVLSHNRPQSREEIV